MRYLQILIIFCSLLLPQVPLQANADQGQLLGHDDLQAVFTKIIKENIPGQVEEFRIANFTSQPETLSVPAGKLTYRVSNEVLCAAPGKKYISANLLVDGKECGKVKMYGDLHFWGTVILASHFISRHTILSADDLKTDFRDISMLGDNQISKPEQAIGKQLSKSLREGDLIFGRLLKSPPLVKRGDLVTIIAKSGGLQITAPGKVNNAGALGEIVRVKNLMSRRILQARVVDQGVVEVDL